jgi:hypothetical protein
MTISAAASLAEYTRVLCLSNSLTLDALRDLRPYPRRIVYAIFGSGTILCAFYGFQSIPYVLIGCFIATEVVFRLLILGFVLVHVYVRSL